MTWVTTSFIPLTTNDRVLGGQRFDSVDSVIRLLAGMLAVIPAADGTDLYQTTASRIGAKAACHPQGQAVTSGTVQGIRLPRRGTDITVGGQGNSLATYFGLYM